MIDIRGRRGVVAIGEGSYASAWAQERLDVLSPRLNHLFRGSGSGFDSNELAGHRVASPLGQNSKYCPSDLVQLNARSKEVPLGTDVLVDEVS